MRDTAFFFLMERGMKAGHDWQEAVMAFFAHRNPDVVATWRMQVQRMTPEEFRAEWTDEPIVREVLLTFSTDEQKATLTKGDLLEMMESKDQGTRLNAISALSKIAPEEKPPAKMMS